MSFPLALQTTQVVEHKSFATIRIVSKVSREFFPTEPNQQNYYITNHTYYSCMTTCLSLWMLLLETFAAYFWQIAHLSLYNQIFHSFETMMFIIQNNLEAPCKDVVTILTVVAVREIEPQNWLIVTKRHCEHAFLTNHTCKERETLWDSPSVHCWWNIKKNSPTKFVPRWLNFPPHCWSNN